MSAPSVIAATGLTLAAGLDGCPVGSCTNMQA
jgi:hypothetical protein